MSTLNLFGLGLLLLTSNLSLCALFAPSGSGSGSAGRLLQLWKLLFLALIEVGAWSVVLHQGGAATSLLETFSRCAACFALAGGEGGGFAPPWGEMKSFIALNGLLFIPVALFPWTSAPASTEHVIGESEELLKIPEDPYIAALPTPQRPGDPVTGDHRSAVAKIEDAGAVSTGTPPLKSAGEPTDPTPKGLLPPPPEVSPTVQPPPISPRVSSAESLVAPPVPERKPFGFRPTIPKVQSKKDAESPESQLAEQMKPVGPTPPPIRFR
jgi:hypothetical protein